MRKASSLGFWQIRNMSFGFLAIQFGFALQNANVSRIFETLGANVEAIPILWIAAPLSVLILLLMKGNTGDKTQNRFERSLHFIGGAILSSLILFLMPNSPVLWIAVVLFWIMAISMKPFISFVGDMLQRDYGTSGFSIFFIGTGAAIASALPYILTNYFGISNVTEAGEKIPESVKLSFYLGGAVFLTSALWVVFSTKKYSSKEFLEFDFDEIKSIKEAEHVRVSAKSLLPSFIGYGLLLLIIGILGSFLIRQMGLENELLFLSVGIGAFGMTLLVSAWYTRQGLVHSSFVEGVADLMSMPKVMKQLAIVQFFSWFAFFTMWIYSTSAVTSHFFGTSDPNSRMYNDGADWVGILFSVYNSFAVVALFCLPFLVKLTSRKVAHAIALVCGGLGLASFYLLEDPHLLVVSMLGVGIAWASILTMPNAILTGSLSLQEMVTFRRLFNLFIPLPMILAAGILGFFTRVLFEGNTVYALILGGTSLLVAAVSVLFVVDQKRSV